MTDPWLFILAVLAILLAPGPTNALLATGGASSLRRALPLLLGALAGYVLAVAAYRLVLGPVMFALPTFGIALKAAVAAYLVFIAVGLWRRPAALAGGTAVTVRQVFVATLLNPKGLIVSLSILPSGAAAIWPYGAAFAAAVPVCGLGWIALGRLAGVVAGAERARLLPRIGAVALAGFAGLLLYSALR